MPRFSANLSMMFGEHEMLDRFAAAKDAGFDAVEIQFPYDIPLDVLAAVTAEARVQLAVFNLPAGDIPGPGPGLAAMPERKNQFREAVALAKEYAATLKPRNVNLLAGWPPAAIDPKLCRDALVENARHAAEEMAPLGVRVVVEACNTRDRPGFFVPTSAAVMALLEEAGHPNLAMEYDIYHMQIMEGDLVPTLERLLPRIGHIQFADTPGRAEPGTGEINFPYVFDAIDAMGYDGWVGAEYFPSGPTPDSLAWLQPYLG